MKKIILVFMSTLFGVIAFGQDLPENPADNSCYTKYIPPSEYEEEMLKFPVYIGDDFEQDFLDTIIIVLEEEEYKFTSRLYEGCRSKNEEDCTVWCWMDIPAVTETIVIVDTTKTKDFIYEYFTKKILIRGQRGRAEYLRVPCEELEQDRFIADLQLRLQEEGFYDGKINGNLDAQTKIALESYRSLHEMMELGLDY